MEQAVLTARRWLALVAMTIAMVIAPVSHAQDDAAGGDWRFKLTPYLWTAGLDGDVGIRGRTASVDVGFDDIFDALDVGALAVFEASRDRWTVLIDGSYLKLSENVDRRIAEVDVTVEQTLLDAMLTYRLGEPGSVELLAGLRYINIDNELDFERIETVSASKDWADPIVGLRLQRPLSERWSFALRADVGGFGASSDLVWQLFGAVSYQLNDQLSAGLGYRHLDIDYDRGDTVFDVQFSGFAFGLSYAF